MQLVVCDVKIWELSLASEKAPISKMMFRGVIAIKTDNINLVRNRMIRGGEDMPLLNIELVMG